MASQSHTRARRLALTVLALALLVRVMSLVIGNFLADINSYQKPWRD